MAGFELKVQTFPLVLFIIIGLICAKKLAIKNKNEK